MVGLIDSTRRVVAFGNSDEISNLDACNSECGFCRSDDGKERVYAVVDNDGELNEYESFDDAYRALQGYNASFIVVRSE